MANFLERQETYTAFRHNLAICAEFHRHAQNVPSIPSHLIATYAAHLEHCISAQSTTDTAYCELVEARNEDLQLAEEDISLWKGFLETHFAIPFVDHEDIIRPMVFANLLVADVQKSREALEKSISSINAALYKQTCSVKEKLRYHLTPEETRQMAKYVEFWDVRVRGKFHTISRSRYREMVSRLVEELKFWEDNKLWDLWCKDVASWKDIEPLDEQPPNTKTAGKKKRKKRGKKKAKSAQQDIQSESGTESKLLGNSVDINPKNETQGQKTHVEATQEQSVSDKEDARPEPKPVIDENKDSADQYATDSSSQQKAIRSAQQHEKIDQASPVAAPPEVETTLPSSNELMRITVPTSPTTAAPKETTSRLDENDTCQVQTSKTIDEAEALDKQSTSTSGSSVGPTSRPSTAQSQSVSHSGTKLFPQISRRWGVQMLLSASEVRLPLEDQELLIEERVAAVQDLVNESARIEISAHVETTGQPQSLSDPSAQVSQPASHVRGIEALLSESELRLAVDQQQLIIEERAAALRSLVNESAQIHLGVHAVSARFKAEAGVENPGPTSGQQFPENVQSIAQTMRTGNTTTVPGDQEKRQAASSLLDSHHSSEAAHTEQNSASTEAQRRESAHVSELDTVEGSHSPVHEQPSMKEMSGFKSSTQEASTPDIGCTLNGDLKNATIAASLTSDTDKEVLLSILQSHTVAKKKKDASKSMEELTPTVVRSSTLETTTRDTPSLFNTSYTIFKSNPTNLPSSITTTITTTSTNIQPTTPHELSITHASNLISLSLFVLHLTRSPTTLPSPLHEIFDASATSINVWLDQPRIWSEPDIVAALCEDVEVLKSVLENYEELSNAREKVKSTKQNGSEEREEKGKTWEKYKDAKDRYVGALKVLGRKLPEEGDRERFLEVLEGEEEGRLGEIQGKG